MNKECVYKHSYRKSFSRRTTGPQPKSYSNRSKYDFKTDNG